MCGICGFVSRGDISLEALRGMNDTMYHRGPNDSGAEIYVGGDGYRVGFALPMVQRFTARVIW